MMPEEQRSSTDDAIRTPLVGAPRALPGPKRPCLVALAGPRLGEIFPLIDGELIVGRDSGAMLRLVDDAVSRRHARIMSVGDGARITDLGSQNGTYVGNEQISERMLREGEKIRIGQTTVLKYVRYDCLEETAQRQLLEQALRDGLTGAFNRRYFVQRLAAEARFADRHHQSLALLLLDIDHFKNINDRFGHLAGDRVLRHFAEELSEALRAEDVLARFGGEEFAVLARGIKLKEAVLLGERLGRRVAAIRIEPKGRLLSLTTSIGVSAYTFDESIRCLAPDDAANQLIARADAALYRAKNRGRDRVEA